MKELTRLWIEILVLKSMIMIPKYKNWRWERLFWEPQWTWPIGQDEYENRRKLIFRCARVSPRAHESFRETREREYQLSETLSYFRSPVFEKFQFQLYRIYKAAWTSLPALSLLMEKRLNCHGDVTYFLVASDNEGKSKNWVSRMRQTGFFWDHSISPKINLVCPLNSHS